jgi:hypothetical protein
VDFKKPEKKSLLVYKGELVASSSDYRALLALLLIAGYLYVLVIGNALAIAGMGPLTGSAVAYYFDSKSRRRNRN